MALQIVHHPDYDAQFPVTHRFPMGKYKALAARLDELGLLGPGRSYLSSLPPDGWLKLAHHPAYVDQVVAYTVPAAIEREIGFPVNERVSRRARLAAAGTVLAARIALERGIACNAAGGSHHARYDQGAGFCTLNDVAVAASLLLAEGEIGQALVFDLDVHQGDGTARIFADEARVFTFSLHSEKNYPVRKAKSDLDIGLPDGTGDDDYLDAVSQALDLLSTRLGPDIVFYNAGVDPHASDRLGRLSLTDDGLRRRDALVIGHFRKRGIPVVGVIGGGYALDIEALAARHAILFETAAAYA